MALFNDKDTTDIIAAWAKMLYKTWTETFGAWAHQLTQADDDVSSENELQYGQWSHKPTEQGRLFPVFDPTWQLIRWSGSLNMKLQKYTQGFWADEATAGKFATWVFATVIVIGGIFWLAVNLLAMAGMAAAGPWFVIGALGALVSLCFMPSDTPRSLLIMGLIGLVSAITTFAWALAKTLINLTVVPFVGLLRAGLNMIQQAFKDEDEIEETDQNRAAWLRRILSGFAMLASLTASGLMFFVFGVPLSALATLLFTPVILLSALSFPGMIADNARKVLNKLPWLVLGLLAVAALSFLFLHLYLGLTAIPFIGLNFVALALMTTVTAAVFISLFLVAGTGRMAQWFWSEGFEWLKDAWNGLGERLVLLGNNLERMWDAIRDNPKAALKPLAAVVGVLSMAATAGFYFGLKMSLIAASCAGSGAVLGAGVGLALLGLAAYGIVKGIQWLRSRGGERAEPATGIVPLPEKVRTHYEQEHGVQHSQDVMRAIEQQQQAGAMTPVQIETFNSHKKHWGALCERAGLAGGDQAQIALLKQDFNALAGELKKFARSLGIELTYKASQPARVRGGLSLLPEPVVQPAALATAATAAPAVPAALRTEGLAAKPAARMTDGLAAEPDPRRTEGLAAKRAPRRTVEPVARPAAFDDSDRATPPSRSPFSGVSLDKFDLENPPFMFDHLRRR